MYSHDTRFGMTLAFLNNPTALGVLLLVVVVLFGGKNIPDLMKGLGQGVREFKKGMEHEDEATSQARREAQEEEARLRVRIEQEVRARMEAEKNAEKNSEKNSETNQASETRKQASP